MSTAIHHYVTCLLFSPGFDGVSPSSFPCLLHEQLKAPQEFTLSNGFSSLSATSLPHSCTLRRAASGKRLLSTGAGFLSFSVEFLNPLHFPSWIFSSPFSCNESPSANSAERLGERAVEKPIKRNGKWNGGEGRGEKMKMKNKKLGEVNGGVRAVSPQ